MNPPSTAASAREREIIDAKVIVTCPGRNFVTLKITTRAGVTGLGDATLNGRELAVASYLKDHVAPNLIGRDASRIEDTWQFLYRGAYWRRGPVTMSAIAAVDVALWDIKGKMAGLPLYQLLGGRSREGALVYAHANGRDIGETSEAEMLGEPHDAGLRDLAALGDLLAAFEGENIRPLGRETGECRQPLRDVAMHCRPEILADQEFVDVAFSLQRNQLHRIPPR